MSRTLSADCSEVLAENRFPLRGGGKCETPGKSVLQCDERSSTVPLVVLAPVAALVFFFTISLPLILLGTGKCPAPVTIPRDPCEDGWIWYQKKCYYFSTNITEWQKSQEFCVSRNATLAIIDLRHELDFITRFKGSSDHWIGLTREYNGSAWLWTNGSVFNNMFQIVGFSDCVLVNSHRISSASCFSDKHWICNKPGAHNSHF